MKELFRRRRHFGLFSLFGVTSLAYFLIGRQVVDPVIVHVPADDLIPFLPGFILPYMAWYAYVPLLMLWVGLRDKTAFYRQCALLFSGILLCNLLFYFFPTAVDFRPEAAGDGVMLRLCRFIFSNDRPVNVCPSLHCFNAVLVHLTAFRVPALRKRRGWRCASAGLAAVICASTVFVKQHSVVDMLCGVGLAVLLYVLFYGVVWRYAYDHQTL